MLSHSPSLLLSLSALLLALVLALTAAFPAAAQEGGIQMSARAAYDGYYKYGEWLPVWVELENHSADVDGEVRIWVQGSSGGMIFAAPVSLPAGAHKRLPVYVLPNNFTRELEVQFVSGEEELASLKVQVQPQPNITYLAGLVTAERGALSTISGVTLPGQRRPMALVDLTPADLPERLEGLRSFDLLVLNDVDTSGLTPQQVQALESWVSGGGRLVIGGGAGAARTAAGLSPALLPLQPTGTQTVDGPDLAGLAEYAAANPIQVPGPFVAATGELSGEESRVLAGEEDSLPLLVEKSLGTGYVSFVALDLTTSPLSAWDGASAFWLKLLSPGGAYPDGMPPDMSARQMSSGQLPYALSNLPVLDLPSTRTLAGLLGLYILLIGPLNYLILKRMRRLHLAWLTIPALTVLFSAGAFTVGYAMRGNDVVLNRISVVELLPGGTANVTSYLGIFSPGSQGYEVEVEGGGLLSPVSNYYDPWAQPGSGATGNEMTFVQGSPGRVRGLSVSQWSLQSFMTEDVWMDFGQITDDLRLEAGSRLVGTLRNESDYDLHDAVLILSQSFLRLGDLPAGAEKEITFDVDDQQQIMGGIPLSYRIFESELNNPGPTGPSRQAELKRMIVESVFDMPYAKVLSSRFIPGGSGETLGSGVTLLGWMDQAPPEVRISGQRGDLPHAQQTTALVYTRLSFGLPEDGTIVLPPGMIPGTLVEMPVNGGMCGGNQTLGVYIASGEAVFEFQAPFGGEEVQVDKLNLSMWNDSGWWNDPATALYDWESETWMELSEVVQGLNEVGNAAAFVDPQGTVRLRIGNDSATSQGCYYVALGLEGIRTNGSGGSN